MCEPHRPDSSSRGDRTSVASGEMDGLGDQCEGCEGKEEGGVRLNMQPLWVDGQ